MLCLKNILSVYKRPAFHSNRLRDFNYLHSLYCFVFSSLPNAESPLNELLTLREHTLWCIYTVTSQLKVSDKEGDPKYLLQSLKNILVVVVPEIEWECRQVSVSEWL